MSTEDDYIKQGYSWTTQINLETPEQPKADVGDFITQSKHSELSASGGSLQSIELDKTYTVVLSEDILAQDPDGAMTLADFMRLKRGLDLEGKQLLYDITVLERSPYPMVIAVKVKEVLDSPRVLTFEESSFPLNPEDPEGKRYSLPFLLVEYLMSEETLGWYNRFTGAPIHAVDFLLTMAARNSFEDRGISVLTGRAERDRSI